MSIPKPTEELLDYLRAITAPDIKIDDAVKTLATVYNSWDNVRKNGKLEGAEIAASDKSSFKTDEEMQAFIRDFDKLYPEGLDIAAMIADSRKNLENVDKPPKDGVLSDAERAALPPKLRSLLIENYKATKGRD